MQDGDTTLAPLPTHRIKGLYVKAFFGKIKAFSTGKNIYTLQRIKQIKVNIFSTSKLRHTFIFLLKVENIKKS